MNDRVVPYRSRLIVRSSDGCHDSEFLFLFEATDDKAARARVEAEVRQRGVALVQILELQNV